MVNVPNASNVEQILQEAGVLDVQEFFKDKIFFVFSNSEVSNKIYDANIINTLDEHFQDEEFIYIKRKILSSFMENLLVGFLFTINEEDDMAYPWIIPLDENFETGTRFTNLSYDELSSLQSKPH